ncbi:histidine kinase, partial [Frankia sp. AgB32]|uniref:sensor histidine kinase n=1 Tax=Frankia sp. AgB32 TaxID=631119 RepID=UPI002010B234
MDLGSGSAGRRVFVRVGRAQAVVATIGTAAGLAFALAVTTWSWGISDHVEGTVGGPQYAFGAICVVIGFLAWIRLAKPRVGVLLMLLGGSYYLQFLRASSVGAVFVFGVAFAYLWTGVIAHLVLAWPDGGRVPGIRNRILLAGCYSSAVLTQALRLVLDDPHGPWLDYATTPRTTTSRVGSVAAIVFALLVATATVRQLVRARTDRRWRIPLWSALLFVALCAMAASVASLAPVPSRFEGQLLVAALEAGVLLLPLVLVAQMPIESLLLERIEAIHSSRLHIAMAALEERRVIHGDLHDGGQAPFYAVLGLLGLARDQLGQADGESPDQADQVRDLVGRAHRQLQDAIESLRDLVRGVYPAALTESGLRAAVDNLADTSPIPIDVDIPDVPLPGHVRTTAYFLIAEAITNAYRHAEASQLAVVVQRSDAQLLIRIQDDGRGAAAPPARRPPPRQPPPGPPHAG